MRFLRGVLAALAIAAAYLYAMHNDSLVTVSEDLRPSYGQR